MKPEPESASVIHRVLSAHLSLSEGEGDKRLMASLMSGTGLSLMECLQLRVQELTLPATGSRFGKAKVEKTA